MRDNEWLKEKLENIWQNYFSDIPVSNKVHIKFGQKARARLGSIKLIQNRHPERSEGSHNDGILQSLTLHQNDASTLITLTGYFQNERVPEYIIDLTIAHELCHYAHGFSSPLPQLSRYPHKGGLVDNELKSRGFAEKLKEQKKWLKTEWPKIIKTKSYKLIAGRRKRRKRINTLSDALKFLFSSY